MVVSETSGPWPRRSAPRARDVRKDETTVLGFRSTAGTMIDTVAGSRQE